MTNRAGSSCEREQYGQEWRFALTILAPYITLKRSLRTPRAEAKAEYASRDSLNARFVPMLAEYASDQLSPRILSVFSPVYQPQVDSAQENAMKTELRILLFLGVLLLVTTLLSCTAGPNFLEDSAGANNVVAGFWCGLWHGFICLFTLIASLFSKSVTIYEVHNNGGWYNFGFVLGVGMFFGCKGRGRRAKPLHSDCSS